MRIGSTAMGDSGSLARRRLPVLLLTSVVVATLTSASAPAQTTQVDLSVANVEVTQAIQTPTNAVRLVARRGTAVRATINVTGAAGPVQGVTGELHVFVDGTEVTPTGGVAPINAPFTAPLSPDRNKENDTLNFELPAPTVITKSNNVDFRVDLAAVPGETNTANNSRSVNDLVAVNRRTPLLFFTRINYTPSGLGPPALADVQPGTGDAFVRGILPVNDSDPALYREGVFPTMRYQFDFDFDGRLDTGPEGSFLLTLLEGYRQVMVTNGVGATDRVFLYGWIAGNPIDGNGLARLGGGVAFGNTEGVRFQRTYAHELTHNFGLDHNTSGLDQVGWDVGARLANNPATNNTTGRVKPIITPGTGPFFDIQNPGRLTNEAWIATGNYDALIDHSTLLPTSISTALEVAVLRGSFDPSGHELIQRNPVFRYPWRSQPSLPRPEGSYVAIITDTNGVTTTRRFSALVADDPEDERAVNGAFTVMVPVNPLAEIASVEIMDASRTITFAALKRSEPPHIAVRSPGPGSVLRGLVEVAWEVDDPDTPSEDLMFEAAYSWNGGRSWVPIGVDIPGTDRSFAFDSRQVRRSKGKGLIRVLVSDGVNTAFADVGELTR